MTEVPGCFETRAECENGYAGFCEYVSKLQEYCRMAFVDPDLAEKTGDRNGAIAGLAVTFGVLMAALIVVWARNCALAASRKAPSE